MLFFYLLYDQHETKTNTISTPATYDQQDPPHLEFYQQKKYCVQG